MDNQLTIVQPSILPPIKEGESPVGYLNRLADKNNYASTNWLLNKSIITNTRSNKLLIPALTRHSWIKLNDNNTQHLYEYSNLHDSHLNKYFRYCPQCIHESGYWSISWSLKASVACIKHNVWLVDECSGCHSNIEIQKVKFDQCSCSYVLTGSLSVKCPTEVIVMQSFLEGKNHSHITHVPLVNEDQQLLTLEERSSALLLFSRVQPYDGFKHKQAYKQLTFMDTARTNMHEVAVTLFGGQYGFWLFLKAINAQGYGGKKTGHNRLIEFYLLFYKKITHAFFNPYKVLLEEFINEHMDKELTRRHSLFSLETIAKHPWISLQQASRHYGISKRTFRRAIENHQLDAKIESCDKNTKVLLFKPDIERTLFRLTDVINATEAAGILGVTKAQFCELRKHNAFTQATPPKVGGNGGWQFSRLELEAYTKNILKTVPVIKADYMCVPEIMRTYGKKIDGLFTLLIDAINAGELMAKTFNAKKGIRSLSIAKVDVLEWIESKLGDVEFYSVPQIAKLLVINQQFTYELVHFGLLRSDLDTETHCHHIQEEQLAAFKTQYILLSKLSKLLKLSSRTLIEFLGSRNIFSVDKGWSVKLRQKVYLRDDIISVYWMESALSE